MDIADCSLLYKEDYVLYNLKKENDVTNKRIRKQVQWSVKPRRSEWSDSDRKVLPSYV